MRWLSALLSICLGATSAHAAPEVEVRARTEIALEPIERTSDGAWVRGRVLEPATGEAVGGVGLLLSIDRDDVRIQADANGEFREFVPMSPGDHELAVSFAGSRKYQGSATAPAPVNLEKDPLDLTVAVTAETDFVEIQIAANASGQPVAVPVEVALGEPGKALSPRPAMTTRETGPVVLTLRPKELGAGRRRVEVRFAGNQEFGGAAAAAEWTQKARTRLSAEAPDELAENRTIKVAGRLVDEFGAAVDLAPILLERAGTTLARAVTDTSGGFQLETPAQPLGIGALRLAVVFESDRPWLEPATLDLSLRVTERKGVPMIWNVFAAAIALGAMAVFLLLRKRPWKRFTERQAAPLPARGLAPAPKGIKNILSLANDTGFSGRVETSRGEPLFRATVFVRTASGETLSEKTGTGGGFRFDALPAGSHEVRADAPGHVSESFAIEIPHRGRLHDVTIRVMEIREHVFDLYRRVAEPLLPERRLAGIWTPRELLEYVRKGKPAPALGELTDLVEAIYFGQASPVADPISATEAKIASAQLELGGSVAIRAAP